MQQITKNIDFYWAAPPTLSAQRTDAALFSVGKLIIFKTAASYRRFITMLQNTSFCTTLNVRNSCIKG